VERSTNPDHIPEDIRYIGDKRTMRNYSATCAARQNIPPESQFYYRTEAGAIAEGFKASADC
jgi:hypothetical protein